MANEIVPFKMNLVESEEKDTSVDTTLVPFKMNLVESEEKDTSVDTTLVPFKMNLTEEEDGTGTLGSITRGLTESLASIPKLLALGIDASLDTDYFEKVTKNANTIKNFIADEPTSTSGKIFEGISSFLGIGGPLIFGVSKAHRVANFGKAAVTVPTSKYMKAMVNLGDSKLGKTLFKGNTNFSRRAKLAGTTTMTGAFTEFLIKQDGTATLSDAFGVLPDALETEDTSNLSGRDKAFAVFRNKFRSGTEAAAIGVVFEAAFPVIGATVKTTAKIPGVSPLAKYISKGFNKLGDFVGDKLLMGLPGKFLTARRGINQKIYEQLSDSTAVSTAQASKMSDLLANFDLEARNVIKGQKLFGRGKVGIQQAHNKLLEFLEGNSNALDMYGKKVVSSASRMRNQIDELGDDLFTELEQTMITGKADPKFITSIMDEIAQNRNGYLRRLYDGAFTKETPDLAAIKSVKANDYDKTVTEWAKRMRSTNKSATDEELLTSAKEVVDNEIVNSKINADIAPQQTLKKFIESLVVGKESVGAVPLFDVAEGIFKERAKGLYDMPSFRNLINEIKDPSVLALRTVSDLSETLTSAKLYKSLSDDFKVPLNQAVEMTENGLKLIGRPSFINVPENASQDFLKFLSSKNYAKLGDKRPQSSSILEDVRSEITDIQNRKLLTRRLVNKEEVATQKANLSELKRLQTIEKEEMAKLSAFGGRYGALSGTYAANEVYNSLNVLSKTGIIQNKLLATALQAKGLSQMSKTVLSPLAQVRNFYSGAFMLAGSGNIMRDMNLGESLRLSFGKYADLPEGELTQYFEFLRNNQVLDTSLAVNEMKELIKKGAKFPDGKTSTYDLVQKLPLVPTMTKLYQGTDNFWKLAAFNGEKSKFSSAINKGVKDTTLDRKDIIEDLVESGIAKRTSSPVLESSSYTPDTLDILAADIVKDVMPIYNRVGQFVEWTKRMPFIGSFVSFGSEMVRNGGNTLGRSLKEMGYKVGDNLKVKIANSIRTSNPEITEEALKRAVNSQVNKIQTEIRAIGANRATSYYMATMGVPKGMVMASQALTGVTDKQIEDTAWARAPWMQGHSIMSLSPITFKNGKYEHEFIDLTYMLPHDMLMVPFRLAIQKYNEKGSVSPNEVGDILTSMWQGFSNFMDPFVGESLMTERVVDVTFRGGATTTGAKIYNKGEAFGEQLSKSMLHVLNGLNPTIIENLITFDKGQVRKGKIAKAITGEATKTGEELSSSEVALTQLSGLKAVKTNFSTALRFKALEYKTNSKGPANAFGQIIGQNDSTKENILNQYDITNNQLYQQQQELYAIIQKARSIGMKDSIIMNSLRDMTDKTGLKGIELALVMQGKFSPLKITPNSIRKILNETVVRGEKRVVTALPTSELLEKFGKASFLSLKETDLETSKSEDISNNVVLKPVDVDFSIPSTDLSNNNLKPVDVDFSIPSTNKKSSSSVRTNPAFMGSNPSDILKNLTIGNRTQ